MSYKDLLVVLDSDATSRRRIDLAAGLAERFAAHLVGLYPLPVPEVPHHLSYYDPAVLNPFFLDLRQQAQAASDVEREAFEHAASLRGVSAEWRVIAEGVEADAALHARYVDLTILGQLDPDRGDVDLIRPRPEQVTFASGRPVLVVPYAGQFETVGRRVLIGWNASREATRAVNDAMPLLMVADIAPGEVLLSRAADLGADLLVIGAYGHSRVRELLLGGATRSILQSMPLPVLMSH